MRAFISVSVLALLTVYEPSGGGSNILSDVQFVPSVSSSYWSSSGTYPWGVTATCEYNLFFYFYFLNALRSLLLFVIHSKCKCTVDKWVELTWLWVRLVLLSLAECSCTCMLKQGICRVYCFLKEQRRKHHPNHHSSIIQFLFSQLHRAVVVSLMAHFSQKSTCLFSSVDSEQCSFLTSLLLFISWPLICMLASVYKKADSILMRLNSNHSSASDF